MSETPPRRGRARRAWLAGYAEARRRHATPVEDGYFATLESLHPDDETLYMIDCLRHEKATGTGAFSPSNRARMGLS